MKNLIKFIPVLFAFAILFTSCSDEVRLANDLEGDWKTNSYKINGDELMPFFTKFDMTYAEYDRGESEGTFTWTLTDAFFGETTTDTGEYSINEDATDIDLVINNELVTLNITVEDDVLTLSGTIDGESVLIVADKQ